MEKRVLITTPYREKGERYEYWSSNVDRKITYTYDKNNSNGLRFLKKNIPQIDILEWSSWNEYKKALNEEDYDVVGFSFFTYEWPRTKKMVKEAKRQGVPEVWAGNYGALTYGVEEYFDRSFIGYSEQEVAEALGKEIDKIEHPMIVDYIGITGGIRGFPLGILFTTRGCSQGCEFCQTPKFCSEPYKLSLSSIEKVLRKYNKAGIDEILVEDESFGLYPKHTDKVISLLEKYDMNWYAMTRVDILSKNLDEWHERGFVGVHLGVESLHQDSLDDIGKNIDVRETLDLLNRLEEKNSFVIGYYMIGFEEDTVDSIKKSIKKLKKYSIDLIQLCVMTPFPKTPLWHDIKEKYGIIENDWSKWNTKHLVWNHPKISQKEMRDVLGWGFKKAYTHLKFLKSPTKHYFRRKERYGHVRTTSKMIKDFIISNLGADVDIRS